MKKIGMALAFLAVGMFPYFLQEKETKNSNTEFKKISGSWEIVSAWEYQRDVKADTDGPIPIVLRKNLQQNGIVITFEGTEMQDDRGNRSNYKVGFHNHQRTITFLKSGSKNEIEYTGIYFVDGSRLLMLLHESKSFPKDFNFNATRKTNGSLVQLKRVNPESNVKSNKTEKDEKLDR